MAITKLRDGLPNQSMGDQEFDEATAKLMLELPLWADEADALAADVTAKQLIAVAKAAIAESAAARALISADMAAALVGAPLWVRDKEYAIGDPVTSLIDLSAYKRRTVGAGTVDPKNDTVNWQPAGGVLDNEVHLVGTNGWGSTNTCVRRYSSVRNNVGAAMTYQDSATLGASITVNQAGIYAISMGDQNMMVDANTRASVVGASVNISAGQGAQTISVIPAANSLFQYQALGGPNAAGAVVYSRATEIVKLNANDVVRPHNNGSSAGITSNAGLDNFFKMRRISGVI